MRETLVPKGIANANVLSQEHAWEFKKEPGGQ